MALNGVIAAFQSGTYTRKRTAAGSTVNGRYTEGSTASTSLVASVQPITGAQLKALPEGRHTEELRVVYTTTELLAAPIPDKVTLDGSDWEVFKVERWEHWNSTHYVAFVSKVVVQ